MQKLYIVFSTLLICSFLQAQIVNIPDANFKTKLLSHNPVIDTNGDNEIQVSEAEVVINLVVSNANINSLQGIDAFVNVENLNCFGNALTALNLTSLLNLQVLNCKNNDIETLSINGLINLTTIDCSENELTGINLTTNVALLGLTCEKNNLASLDVSLNPALSGIYCGYNPLMSLDVTQNSQLYNLSCNSNQLSSLDLSQNRNLGFLYCPFNQLTSLDLTNNGNITFLNCTDNYLTSLFIKNGGSADPNTFYFYDNFDLAYICVDEEEYDVVQAKIEEYNFVNCTLNSYCTFNPGGEFDTLEGLVNYNFNDDNCVTNYSFLPDFKLELNDSNSNLIGSFSANLDGEFNVPITENATTINPRVINQDYFTITPDVINIAFGNGDIVQDFCISPNGNNNDLEIIMFPINQAIPGFDAQYGIRYSNRGTTALSGTVDFYFSDNSDESTFVEAFPTQDNLVDGVLTWNYSNLQPFESRQIEVLLNLNAPTDMDFPLNDGDILSYNAQIFPVVDDETPSDNGSSLRQIVVNSFDPNDKTCLEGETITPEMIGEYVHYMIRFENLGTANAINVVVKDEIDTNKFDINTLIPLHASHNFVTRIQNINNVEFIFENINLPFDDATNDGFVVFKIKTLDTLVLDDTFTNDAEIYFDFNFPIITNDYLTTVAEDNLSVDEFLSNTIIKLFPNPVNGILNISSETILKSISISDINGRILQSVTIIGNQNETSIDLQNLSKGIYFVNVTTESGTLTEKIIKD